MMGPARAALLAAVTLFAGCTANDVDSTSVAAPPTPAAVAASVVGVVTTGCGPSASTGSGVVIDLPGRVVTAAHTVAGADTITVVDEAGQEWPADLAAIDVAADLAVLAVDGFTAPPLNTADVTLGSAVAFSWSPRDGLRRQDVDVTTRLAITIDDIYGEESVQRSGLEIAADIEVGDSGGPVVSSDGAVIGIVYARSQSRASIGFATDATEIGRVIDAATSTPIDTGRCVR